MSLKKRLIITGGTGFIGSYLLKQLLSDGHEVFAVTRRIDQSFNHPHLIWTTWDTYKNDIPKNKEIYAVLNLATAYGQNNESEHDILNCNVVLPMRLFKFSLLMGAKKIINADSFFGKPQFDYQHLKIYIKSKNKLIKEAQSLIMGKEVSL